MSDTVIAYGGAKSATCLRACYAICSTEMEYAGTRGGAVEEGDAPAPADPPQGQYYCRKSLYQPRIFPAAPPEGTLLPAPYAIPGTTIASGTDMASDTNSGHASSCAFAMQCPVLLRATGWHRLCIVLCGCYAMSGADIG
eukprot:1171906-Rhodomonas_salina.1